MGTAKQRKAQEGDCPTAKKAKLFEMGTAHKKML